MMSMHTPCLHGSGAIRDPKWHNDNFKENVQKCSPEYKSEERHFQIFAKTLTGKTISLDVNIHDKVEEIKRQIEFKCRLPTCFQCLVFRGKQLDDKKTIGEYNVIKENTVHVTAYLKGGMFQLPANINTPEGIMTTFSEWSTKLNELQQENARLKGEGVKGIRKVIQSGSKDLTPKKFSNIATSGSFRSWARELKDYARMADPKTLTLIKLGEESEDRIDVNTDVPDELMDLDQDLHYFISKFLDGEAKLLALNADIGDLGTEHKSGAELWRLLTFNYEKKSAYHVVSVVEMIKSVEKAKSMADVQAKIATLHRLYIEFAKGFNESTDSDIRRVKTHLEGMSTIGYFDVFKKSDLIRILPESVLRDLKRSPDIKLELISYDDLLRTVTQLVKDSNTTATPMDLDAINEVREDSNEIKNLNERNRDDSHDHNDELQEMHNENTFEYPHVYGDDGSLYYLTPKGRGKGQSYKGKGKGGFDGNCLWCGRYGHRLSDCRDYTGHLQRGGAPLPKGKGKGKSEQVKGFTGYGGKGGEKGKSAKGQQQQPWGQQQWGPASVKGGYANHVGNEYAPYPVPLASQVPSAYPQLMAAPWSQGFVGSLCPLDLKNQFSVLAHDDVEYPSLLESINSSSKKANKGANKTNTEKVGDAQPKKIHIANKQRRGMHSRHLCGGLNCLLAHEPEESGHLNPIHNQEWEKVSFMVDSGASETVANSAKFVAFETVETSASGTEYSCAGNGGPSIMNVGEKRIEVVDESGNYSFMKVQVCDNLNPKKFLASVSRINQAGHRVVFDDPSSGSYIENKLTGARRWLRQEGGVFFLDLWVVPEPTFGRQGAHQA